MSECLARYQESFDYVISELREGNVQPRFVMQHNGHMQDMELDGTCSLDEVIINPSYFVDAAHMFIPLSYFKQLLKLEGLKLQFTEPDCKKLEVC